ncbi:hypothetical protein [Flavisolibacter nicotianae]|uniref:hypothetical protein n=1 Tax=Flavisolibacter nicotianae TaxID=2364882 RepID=UPI000EB547C7|nr:hypothetical protein [Flavisolibacter nicotianae]
MPLQNNGAKVRLQQLLFPIAFFNLLLVASIGLLLRSVPFLPHFPLDYKNLLHGHSHFAFGGWVLPVLLALLMKMFPALRDRIAYRHWRNIAALVLVSAYGMLLSFPVQGYKAVSISFSTLSIAATFYLAIVCWKAAKGMTHTTSLRFVKWGLLYASLSAIGPFATGPLIAMGKSGSPIYFDAIYFYLHFQYNGFFTFAVIGLLYQLMEQQGTAANGRKAFWLLNGACLPTYALSVLWSEPSIAFNLVGAMGGLLQVAGVVYLLKDWSAAKALRKSALLKWVLSAFVLKNVLQLFSALPAVALLAYHSRNFVIAYLHLVLLGFISLFVFSQVFKSSQLGRYGVGLFLFSFFTTELLLVLNASPGLLGLTVPYYAQLLLGFSVFFPVGVALMVAGLGKKQYFEQVEPGEIKLPSGWHRVRTEI